MSIQYQPFTQGEKAILPQIFAVQYIPLQIVFQIDFESKGVFIILIKTAYIFLELLNNSVMKHFFYSFVFSLAILTVGCQQNEPVLPAETVLDVCGKVGTVMENACGLYVQMEDGVKIYTEDTKGFTLRVGEKVQVGYFRSASSSSQSHTCDGNDDDDCGCGSSEANAANDIPMSEKESCMYDANIARASLTCIESYTGKD